MVLSRSQYENMSKEEFIQEFSDTNSSLVNDIVIKLSNLLDQFNKFKSKYDNVHSELINAKPLTLIYLLCNLIRMQRFEQFSVR